MANQAAVRSWWPSNDDGAGTMTYTVMYGVTYNGGASVANEAYTSFTASETANATQLKTGVADAVRAHATSELGITIGTNQVLLQDGTRM